jgi:hypothetical protein
MENLWHAECVRTGASDSFEKLASTSRVGGTQQVRSWARGVCHPRHTECAVYFYVNRGASAIPGTRSVRSTFLHTECAVYFYVNDGSVTGHSSRFAPFSLSDFSYKKFMIFLTDIGGPAAHHKWNDPFCTYSFF